MTEADFRSFIGAISNDIINWDTLKTVMKNGGVTYADTKILTSDNALEVQEFNHAKSSQELIWVLTLLILVVSFRFTIHQELEERILF